MALAVALSASPVLAQNTSSALGGQVTGTEGKPVAGATVTIKHIESGSVSTAVTDANGRYVSRGLRVGGPYTITITKDGVTETRENVYLQLAETKSLDASLGAPKVLDTVQVTGVAMGSEVFSADKMGSGTNLNRAQIDALPSATRNIQDFIRLDPRIAQTSKADGSISVGGQNSRYNQIRIDGVSASDPFGLEANNLPTERQPVSMDAIEAINIGVADYDVTIAGAVGAVVNAVTKSGTNDFKGSAYYSFRDGDWVRKELNGTEFNGFTSEETYGGTFGGPIVEDKLFFFANYEKFTRAKPGVGLSGTPARAGGTISAADIQAIQARADALGFDAGSLSAPNGNTEIEEYAIKLDWNITDAHRASLRYSKTEQSVLRFPQLDTDSISLSSFWYAQPKTFDNTVLQLYSDWAENFSTEFKVSQRKYDALRSPFSNLPEIQIRGFGSDRVYLGTEINTHVNIVGSEQNSVFGAANWYVGDHQVKFGFDWENNDVINFYGRNLNGSYVFNSLADFQNGVVGSYSVRFPAPGNDYEDIAAAYEQKNLALFVQDVWAVNSNLTLNFGLRWDKPEYEDQRLKNDFIEGIYGYDNTNVIDTSLLQPRFGFNYTFDSERPKQVRGGFGLFQGASPNVWIAGIYGNTGLNYLEWSPTGTSIPAFSTTLPPTIPSSAVNSSCFPVPTLSNCPRQNVDLLEPGLALPSAWKANIAFEQELPWDGIVFSVEFLKTKVNNAFYVERLDIANAAGQDYTRIGRDGRELYWKPAGYTVNASSSTYGSSNAKNYRPIGVGDVMLIRNTDKGDSTQITFGLERPMANDWAWSFAYTFTEAREVSPMTSSQNTSNWNGQLSGTVNSDVAFDSRYAIRDRFTGTLDWQHSFFGDYKTRVGVFYEGRSGRPFSYIFANDMNGDNTSTSTVLNDLFYVPAGPGDVLFTGGSAMETNFFNWLADNPELAKYAGQIAPANGFRTGFVHNFDVRISQELPGFFKGHKSVLALDIMNFGNLLNKKWGQINDYGFFATSRVARYAGMCTAVGVVNGVNCTSNDIGKYVYNFNSVDAPSVQENNEDRGNTGVSRWSVLATFRYEF